ncbi:hypothetical protein N0V95_000973 [Ascochyta clinopodiicola]|nr:hypothetical protein N0V95_000973 [Ascochyta clinopodiicola]
MRVSSLSTTALLSGLALAQNATDSKTCTNQWTLDQVSTGRINSTGSESFTWNSDTARDQGVTDPWFVSVTVNETLPGSEGASSLSNGGTIAWAYLSVPESARDVSVCAYQFKPRNATSSGNGGTNDVGCGGVLSDRCTTYLREALLNQTSGGYQSTLRCGSLPNSERERREEACGPLESIASTGYQNLTNSTCTYPSLSGVSLPQNYTTQNMLSSLNPFDASLDTSWANYSARAYDLLVVQSMPVAIVATFGSGVGGTRTWQSGSGE